MLVTAGSEMDESATPPNAPPPMLVTAGSEMELSEVQLLNAKSPMLVTAGRETDESAVQLRNASYPMLVTLSCIVTLTRLLQSRNTTGPMLVTRLPISTTSAFDLFGMELSVNYPTISYSAVVPSL